MDFVRPLAFCGPDVAHRVGGKALGLSHLIAAGLPVPHGFTVTTDAYLELLEGSGLTSKVEALTAGLTDISDNDAASAAIVEMFLKTGLPVAVAAEITAAYLALGGGQEVPVAVRSSATAEDTADASFAGQQDTYLWICGEEAVRDHVLRCWASLFTSRAIAYRARFNIPVHDIAMGVVVQQMVDARAAGVMMTLEPVTGDTSQIYIESALGLGEGVVKGDVESDRTWIDKDTLTVQRREIVSQRGAYMFDPALGAVQLVSIQPGDGAQPSVSDEALVRLARLGRGIETSRGVAMDIEWAVTADGEINLLQARPETVWSGREVQAPITAPTLMHEICGENSTWTTTNAGEAVPGVQTPLSAQIMAIAGEESFRRTLHELGALSRDEVDVPGPIDDRLFGWFFGRLALHLDILCGWMDRVPGVSSEAMALQIFGHTPVGYTSRPARRYYPKVALKLGRPFITGRRRVMNTRRETEELWRVAMRRLPHLDDGATRQLLLQAVEQHRLSMFHHTSLMLGAIQPAYDFLEKIAAQSGVSAQELMGGHGGHEETAMVRDLWACSRKTLSLEGFIDRHGYHGPREGELSAAVWREDPRPLLAMIEGYRAKKDIDDPVLAQTQRMTRRIELEAQFIEGLPASKRVFGRVALKLAGRYLPARGVGKAAFLQAFDVIRASARRMGMFLAESGEIDNAEDVFFLTLTELIEKRPVNARALVAERRKIWARYHEVDLPSVWVGPAAPAVREFDPDAETVDGVAASPGVIEGRVRVVLDNAAAELEPGEILVARDTDPAWASLMFLSAGLIADIGGVMSHTAVVARELGLPCVVSTRNATRILHTGDRVRLDGNHGSIRIVERADRPATIEPGVSA